MMKRRRLYGYPAAPSWQSPADWPGVFAYYDSRIENVAGAWEDQVSAASLDAGTAQTVVAADANFANQQTSQFVAGSAQYLVDSRAAADWDWLTRTDGTSYDWFLFMVWRGAYVGAVANRYVFDVGSYGSGAPNAGLQMLLTESVANTSSAITVRYGANLSTTVQSANLLSPSANNTTRWFAWGANNQTATYRVVAGSGLSFTKTSSLTRSAATAANTRQARVGAQYVNSNPVSAKVAVWGFVRGMELTAPVAAQFQSWATATFGAVA